MNFWNNDVIDNQGNNGDFSISNNNEFKPIPNNTEAIATIVDANWREFDGNEYIEIKWQIVAPAQYANRVIFQKLKVLDQDSAKSSKAQKMLLAINYNAGGRLHELRERPDDMDLKKSLQYKLMNIKILLWEFNDKQGNWIGAVKPKQALAEEPTVAPTRQAPKVEPRVEPKVEIEYIPDEDEEIGF